MPPHWEHVGWRTSSLNNRGSEPPEVAVSELHGAHQVHAGSAASVPRGRTLATCWPGSSQRPRCAPLLAPQGLQALTPAAMRNRSGCMPGWTPGLRHAHVPQKVGRLRASLFCTRRQPQRPAPAAGSTWCLWRARRMQLHSAPRPSATSLHTCWAGAANRPRHAQRPRPDATLGMAGAPSAQSGGH